LEETTQETDRTQEVVGTDVKSEPETDTTEVSHAHIINLVRQNFHNFSEREKTELLSVVNNPKSL